MATVLEQVSNIPQAELVRPKLDVLKLLNQASKQVLEETLKGKRRRRLEDLEWKRFLKIGEFESEPEERVFVDPDRLQEGETVVLFFDNGYSNQRGVLVVTKDGRRIFLRNEENITMKTPAQWAETQEDGFTLKRAGKSYFEYTVGPRSRKNIVSSDKGEIFTQTEISDIDDKNKHRTLTGINKPRTLEVFTEDGFERIWGIIGVGVKRPSELASDETLPKEK